MVSLGTQQPCTFALFAEVFASLQDLNLHLGLVGLLQCQGHIQPPMGPLDCLCGCVMTIASKPGVHQHHVTQ